MYELRPIDDIQVGDRVSITKTVTEADGAMYVAATGDFGPVHVDDDYATTTRFGERLAPGILIGGICTSILSAELVGTLGVSIRDCFWFTGAVRYGDTLTFELWVSAKDEEARTVDWQASARNQEGTEVLKVDATLKFPRKKASTT
ncbi:MaoC/PaaZ C-terminal domain-containing protein [Mangrovicoccus sp. HB161399]|uniref:MaoC family dehydratase n=1 Tax=Mangrovicoccus sp. HB161399 TaxID=2720392 RepID=UPI0015570D3A|nr:MaoC/PaaZ C-terminal domain-containing protein [Mangrovicoccus sp. HB161399]